MTSLGPKVREVVLWHGEIVGAGWSLGEHANLVDVVGDELSPPDLEDLDGLPRGLQGRALSDPVARRTVAVDQDRASPSTTNV